MNDDTYERYSGGTIGGPVVCRTCGCRLAQTYGQDGPAWEHFRFSADTDARGCRPTCLHLPHARDGRAVGVHSAGAGQASGLAAAP